MSRTIVNLKDDLMEKAQKLTGLTKKVEIVNLALEQFVRQKELEAVTSLKGKVAWRGNLKAMRRNRFASGG